MTAGVVGTNVALNGKTCGLHIELFGDVFTDLDYVSTAYATGTGSRFMAVFNTGQFRWEWVASGGFIFNARSRRGEVFQFRFNRFQIGGPPCVK
jgi:hypothetical protein